MTPVIYEDENTDISSSYSCCMNEFLKRTLNHIGQKYGEGVFGINLEGEIKFASSEFLSIIDQPEETILHKNLKEFIGPADFQKYFITRLSDLLNGNSSLLTFECAWQTDTTRPLRLSFTIYPISEGQSLFCCFVKRMSLQSNLCKIGLPTQVYLEQIMNHISAVMWLASPAASEIYYMTPNFENLYEMTYEELAADPRKLIDRVHPDDRDHFMKAYSIPETYSLAELGFRYLRKDGTWRHITAYRFFIKDDSGDPIKVAGISIDDTNLYLARENLAIQQEILARKNKELEKTNKMLEDFTAFACHDLSQPLRLFKTHIQILEKNYLEAINEEGKQILNSVYSAVQRMQDLIKGMADLSLIKSGASSPQLLDVEELLNKKILPLFINSLYPECQIRTKVLKPLPVSENHLIILFKNLIENGIKYNNKIPCIKINSKRFKSGIVYTISDNGIGIPKEAHKQIFSLGRRLYAKTDQSGTGIGLSACEKIISLYEGKIWLHSKPGMGTTFYLFFPLQ